MIYILSIEFIETHRLGKNLGVNHTASGGSFIQHRVLHALGLLCERKQAVLVESRHLAGETGFHSHILIKARNLLLEITAPFFRIFNLVVVFNICHNIMKVSWFTWQIGCRYDYPEKPGSRDRVAQVVEVRQRWRIGASTCSCRGDEYKSNT